ncbi:MAG: chemotaxis protein CheB [Bryobacteraceae bacterium]
MPKKNVSGRSPRVTVPSSSPLLPAPEMDRQESEIALSGIVGVGASAGGLEAFTELLRKLPDDTAMAFVFIQHLDPKQTSHLVEILAKICRMPVSEVREDTRAEANHVYVNAPQFNMGISDGILHATPRQPGPKNFPINEFFSALAEDQGNRASGVVLSGIASDGTIGLQAIKAAGGSTFAQEKLTAKFDGMPASAIGSGAVDSVLTPAGIARQLVVIGHSRQRTAKTDAVSPEADTELVRIFRRLRIATGVDFSYYKQSTIQRRIDRRMALRGFRDLEAYRRDLEKNNDEANALCEACFITVTSFFRKPSVFEELKSTVIPAITGGREPDDPLRIWVPGCSSGEEAYSIAICVLEHLEATGQIFLFKVFASDTCEGALEKARAGVYSDASMAHMSPQRLAKFFIKTDRGYLVSKALRDSCIFAKHNVAADPPFSKLDLISCCNLLIYLGPVLQDRVLSIFQYALKPDGFLLLGPSESASSRPDLFRQVDKACKIYSPRPVVNGTAPYVGERRRATDRPEPGAAAVEHPSALGNLKREADRMLLAEYAPAGVIINDEMNIVEVRGRTSAYLELSPGNPSNNLLKMAREGLIAGLGQALRAARLTNAPACEQGFRMDGQQMMGVAIRVMPLIGSSSVENRYFLVTFEDLVLVREEAEEHDVKAGGNNVSARLRDELGATKEYLRSIVDDKAIALDDLRSANEEAQAANEELQTSQEELESSNEELNTLNESLKLSILEVNEVNRDLTNLLESISIPLVMVGRDLRVRRFTRAMESILNLIPSDVGRSITDLQPKVELPDLRPLLLAAMEGGDRKPREIRDAHGHWFSMHILPSLGMDGSIDGAVLILTDIDASKRGRDFAEAIVETVREPLVILDQNLKVLKANKAFYAAYQTAPDETEHRVIYDLGNGQWNIPKLRELLENILPTHAMFEGFEVKHEFQQVGRKVMLLNAREIFDANAQTPTILLAIEDTTERKQAEEALQKTNTELQHFAYALTHDLQEPLRMVVNFTDLLGREYAGKLGPEADSFIAYSVEGALRIEALLKALLTYWAASDLEPTLTSVNCATVLSKAIANLQIAITESLAVVTFDPLPTVVTEEVMLVQLFQNLLSNSIKYRAEESPCIHISAEVLADEWVFSVRDNGIGIDPEDASRVFGMFKRLHGTEIPGTGIGLALCKKVVERQGGRIWVEPGTGPGAVFKFSLPNRHNHLGRSPQVDHE